MPTGRLNHSLRGSHRHQFFFKLHRWFRCIVKSEDHCPSPFTHLLFGIFEITQFHPHWLLCYSSSMPEHSSTTGLWNNSLFWNVLFPGIIRLASSSFQVLIQVSISDVSELSPCKIGTTLLSFSLSLCLSVSVSVYFSLITMDHFKYSKKYRKKFNTLLHTHHSRTTPINS